MSAVYILWLRQMKRYVRSRSRVLGAIGQPLLFLLALGYGLGSVYKRAGAGNCCARGSGGRGWGASETALGGPAATTSGGRPRPRQDAVPTGGHIRK